MPDARPLPRVIKHGFTEVVDVEMPELDGPVTTRKARRLPASLITVEPSDQEAFTAPAPRVIGRARAQWVAEPFVVPDFDVAPVCPLPEPELPLGFEEDTYPRVDEPETRADVQALLDTQQALFKQELAAATEAARAEGFAQGRAEAEAEAEALLHTHTTTAAQQLDAATRMAHQLFHDSQPLLLQLTFDLAERLLDTPLTAPLKTITEQSLSMAVDRLAGRAPLTVTLHPVDLLHLEESGVLDQLSAAHPELDWDADAEMPLGDWIVRSPDAVVRHLKDEILAHLRGLLLPTDAPALPAPVAPPSPDSPTELPSQDAPDIAGRTDHAGHTDSADTPIG